jgi:hypothetical protein
MSESTLTPEQWKAIGGPGDSVCLRIDAPDFLRPPDDLYVSQSLAPQTIAVANHLLPDDDPRKITRNRVNFLRSIAAEMPKWGGYVGAFADALESYIPPEE